MNRDLAEYLEILGFDPVEWARPGYTKNTPTNTSTPQGSQNSAHSLEDSKALQTLQTTCQSCTKCPLQSSRNRVVFGTGNLKARLMFVGEAPSVEDDLRGEPFLGPSGELLNKMIEAMGFKRNEVYITHLVKCRAPDNRKPETEEINKCFSYLKKQIELIKPEVVVALGSFAAQTLLVDDSPISRLRGKFYPISQFTSQKGNPLLVLPTFHPAYLLRNSEMKKPVWQDLKLVMEYLKSC